MTKSRWTFESGSSGESVMVLSSLVGAAGRIYVASQEGLTKVIKVGPSFEELAANQLDDAFDASPAIAGDELYLRGREFLYCIAGSSR